MTDQELLSAYCDSRNVDSLDAFVNRYEGPLLRFASRMLADDVTAQDVVQEAFLRVAQNPRRLLKVDSCHNWLIRVVRNICFDHIRKAVRRRRAMKVMRERAQLEASPPEAAIESAEARVQVHEAIQRLSPRLREVVILKVQEGKSYREIAAITGLSVTNVGYLLHQAMKKLSKELAAREVLP